MDGTMEVAALGRPFSLGMLYDCRRDSLVPGLTLWDCEDLERLTRKRPKPNNEFKIVASESIEDKSSALDVKASLKASFCSGLVQVDGSAKYLNNNKTSKNQARVTLTYKATTVFEELSMDHLGTGNVKHPYVFDKGIATHVVTAILYGAQAFFVFDREVSKTENHQDIQGNLKVMIKKIPSLAVEGEGSLKMEEKDKENTEKFSCSFFGDFSLQKMPTSFQDAVQVYQSLPKLLGASGENAVPMKVWLLPLTTLDSSAAKLVHEISVTLVQESQKVLEDFSELEMRCNDALKTNTAQQFPQIREKIQTFKESCTEFKLEFQQMLAKKLPSIRGGEEEEAVLAGILKKRRSSPFSSKNLHKWMDCKEREINTLMSLTDMMTNTKIVPSENHIYKESLRAEHVVGFVFTSLGSDEPFLSALSDYLRTSTEPENTSHPQSPDAEKDQWYASKAVADSVRVKAKLFRDFAEANMENKNITFVTAGLPNETQRGSSIYLYKDGFPVSEDFEPPSKPETVTVSDINHDSVTLKIDPPKFGSEETTSFSVEYRVSEEEGWKQQTASKAEAVTVTGLSPNTEFTFRVRAGTTVGVGPAYQVSGPVKTLPCSPPGRPQLEPNSREILVSWKKPAQLGPELQVLKYIVEFTKTESTVNTEDLQWNQMMTREEKTIISGLQSETEYVVRVRCDCGGAGRSKESSTGRVQTTKTITPLDKILMGSTMITSPSTSPSVYKLTLKEEKNKGRGWRRFTFGTESKKPNRTIILLGPIGSGKSTIINGIINYILGVDWKDKYRFKISDKDEGQTSEVTVYKINHQRGLRIDHSLTIIDTPGFGDTRGINNDREIREQLLNLFSTKDGVTEVDVVCLVVQASLARLTPTQKFVFDSVLSVFGKDIEENIRVLVTFADGRKPPVLETIKTAGVPCPKTEDGLPCHFKFNNQALFPDNQKEGADSLRRDDDDDDDDDGGFDEMFWNMGMKSMKRFFVALNTMETKSLKLTKEVLRERKQLENSVEKLQEQVKIGLDKLEEIKETSEKIKELEAEISRNETFEIETTIMKPVMEDISGSGLFLTNCQQCSFTCHDDCAYKDHKDKRKCVAMGPDGHCKVCPGKCYWNVHFNQKYTWEFKQVTEKQTVAELKEKYNTAKNAKSPVEELLKKLKAEYNAVQATVQRLIKRSGKSLNRLKEIALRPNPLSTPDYIDLLIEAEKSEGQPGWKKRVESLQEMKKKAEYLEKIERGEKLL